MAETTTTRVTCRFGTVLSALVQNRHYRHLNGSKVPIPIGLLDLSRKPLSRLLLELQQGTRSTLICAQINDLAEVGLVSFQGRIRGLEGVSVNVTIQQRRFTLRSEYDISGPGFKYHAQKKLFSFFARLRLVALDGRELAKLKKLPSLFKARFEFQLSDGRVYQFRCEKFWKGVFLCQGEKGYFRLYQHKGLKYSIFEGERQIAAFTKNSLTVGKGDRYDIRMDQDADVVMVICLALTVDATDYEDHDATVTFDFGNIGPEDRRFDESWEPD